MDVRIGINGSARELSLETSLDAAAIRALVEEARADEAKLVVLEDTRGRQLLIAGSAITYIELGTDSGRRVGFVD